MAGSHVAHAAYKGPSVLKEILIGITLGIAAGGLWKMHHWKNQKRTKEFYDMLEKDEISVVVNEEFGRGAPGPYSSAKHGKYTRIQILPNMKMNTSVDDPSIA
ncbi:Cytochrome c oxidase subunit 5C [Datura stramonium]|uniref:Cytochrome c oxidase subunit 5C n=1 Tax=Datura stramonium TaxID=4076 RepID=A0ABS8T022_DATST|nr:Cytochrome c oxidase subunit 5C [Datura stramonium]